MTEQLTLFIFHFTSLVVRAQILKTDQEFSLLSLAVYYVSEREHSLKLSES